MKILGIGCDIIEIDRISKSIQEFGRKFYQKLFTEKEIDYCLSYKDSERHFAGRFAAKEAIAKALGVGFGNSLAWHDLEILNNSNGTPKVSISARVLDQFGKVTIEISISHNKTSAIAYSLAYLED